MKHPDSLFLYVESAKMSADFFSRLFESPIVESSENFAMIALPSGQILGLWAAHDVSPKPTSPAGGFEIGVTLKTDAQTDEAFAQAHAMGARIIQDPVVLDFGYTFVLASPDGHLVRVFAPH